MSFIVTVEWVKANSTSGCGYTDDQIRVLTGGPIFKGWLRQSVGKRITEDQRLAFENSTKAKKKAEKELLEIATPKKVGRQKKKKKLKGWLTRHRRMMAAQERLLTETKPSRPIFSDGKSWAELSKLFFVSDVWRKLRYRALVACGGKCQCCGYSQKDGAVLHVDHVKPRYYYQHLELELTNLQVLCEDCNLGKGAWDETDWRTDEQRAQLDHMRSI